MGKIITGDALDLVGRSGGVLLHQTNCIRVAGAGIALQIRNRWPSWFNAFRADGRKLGDATLFRAQKYPAVWIGNLYAQQSIGRGSQQTSYRALESALDTMAALIATSAPDTPIYAPFGMGSGLGGGNWMIISRIINERLPATILVRLPDRSR